VRRVKLDDPRLLEAVRSRATAQDLALDRTERCLRLVSIPPLLAEDAPAKL